jgi:hypothetical protein
VLHGLNDTVVAPEQLRRSCTMFVENAGHDFVMPENTSAEPD